MKKLFTIVLLLASLVGFAQQMSNCASKEKIDNGAKVNLFYEDFETMAIPGNMVGWTLYSTNANETWEIATGGAHTGTQYIAVSQDFSQNPQNETIESAVFSLTGSSAAHLSFWFKCNNKTLAIDSGYSDLTASAFVSGSLGWDLWRASTDPNWADTYWYYVDIPLNAQFADEPTVHLTFNFFASALEWTCVPMFVDDVQVFDNELGIEGAEGMISIQTYPNPATDFICFAAEQKILEISLYNATGALSLSQNTDRTQVQLDISQLSEGLYIAKIRTEEGVGTKTINITR